ncbi:MAG: glycerophosphodiester phosphodiesterase family protein [Candidatus Thorarchaeota archaeon]|nr:glycerophosphodiester phosphodiesterase family protein [Candidatus Thorarchaeota archaeon]
MNRPLIIGHRGAPAKTPENTLESFEKAISLGSDMVELDLQETVDGHLVVIHDYEVSRISSIDGMVSEMHLSELKSLDLGDGCKIPTLGEVLDICHGKCKVNIEIKVLDVERKALEAVKQRSMLEEVIFSSFLHGTLSVVKDLEPHAETAVLYNEPMDDPISYAIDLQASAINPLFFYLEESVVKSAHDAGLNVYPWTINDVDMIAEFVRMGVDGIITDLPDVCFRVIQKMLG